MCPKQPVVADDGGGGDDGDTHAGVAATVIDERVVFVVVVFLFALRMVSWELELAEPWQHAVSVVASRQLDDGEIAVVDGVCEWVQVGAREADRSVSWSLLCS